MRINLTSPVDLFLVLSFHHLQGFRLKVKLSLCLIKHYAMKAYEGVDAYIHIFLTSALL
jgi:hypothetical protein